MAAESTESVTFTVSPDIFKLVRHAGGVQFWAEGPGGELQMIFEELGDCKLTDGMDLSFIGRPVGKLDLAASAERSGVEGEEIKSLIQSWFPVVEGNVVHVNNMSDWTNALESEAFVVGKFSAEWCGPCKMVAPKIEKLSVQWPNVKFLHVDVDHQKAIASANDVNCMPTFLFWKNGTKLEEKVEGANVNAIKEILTKNCGEPQQLPGAVPFTEEVTLNLSCVCDEWTITGTDEGVKLTINGKEQPRCPELKINPSTGKFKFGRSTLSLNPVHAEKFQEIADSVKALFPTNVIHIAGTPQFDQILKNNLKVVAKFSADWCGPCHMIAPTFNKLSIDFPDVRMLHVDVDHCKELSIRESIQAMPTFKFYMSGQVQGDYQVQGARKEDLKQKITQFNGVSN